MPLKKKPVTGMKDILPEEMEIRNYCIAVIRETYAAFGFSSIETPVVEHIENLLSKQGGENEKLIFKILKRGEKLDLSAPTTEEAVTDSGLRYDLTLPLARYYSAHAAELPSPFKALQIGPVFRADRPQRGRYRQFTQCDISGFTIRINDRRLLKSIAEGAGFSEQDMDSVFITLDKMDKIGPEGVRKELEEKYDAGTVERYLTHFAEPDEAGGIPEEDLALCRETGSPLPEIMAAVNAAKTADFRIVYDPTLVRGMGYYTGPIFEISMDEYGGSVGGGGRYDEMIGKFTGQPAPAVGFSIGFERIIMLLLENGFKVPGSVGKTAFLLDKRLSPGRMGEVLQEAMALRREGKTVDISTMKKNRKFQKDQLTAGGYSEIREFFAD